MTRIQDGIYTREEIKRLTWPVAWNGPADTRYEAAVRALGVEADEVWLDPDAAAVEVKGEKIVAIQHAEA